MIEDTLVTYGPEFQRKCVTALMTDKLFLEQMYDIVTPEYFESEANRWLVATIRWFYQTYKTLPLLENFYTESRKIDDGVLRLAIRHQLKQIHHDLTPADLQYVKDVFLDFCKIHALKNAIMESAELLKAGKLDEVKLTIDKAHTAGTSLDFGHDYFEDADKRLVEEFRQVIPTPWECVNETMKGGGIAKGELGCVMAATGHGKSWFLAAIGLHALRLGKRVVHISLEMSDCDTGNRYDSILTGIDTNEIQTNAGVVRDALFLLQPKMKIQSWPGGVKTANSILAYLQRMASLGNKPDMVIIDYADRLRSVQRARETYQELGFIFDELTSVCQQMEVVGWTATQAQRAAANKEVVEGDNVGGSYAKLYSTTFMLTVSRQIADKLSNTGRVHIAKNRVGRDGGVFPAVIDFSHGVMDIYRDDTPEGLEIRQRISEAKQRKSTQDRLDLRAKWTEHSKKMETRTELTDALNDMLGGDEDAVDYE